MPNYFINELAQCMLDTKGESQGTAIG